MERLHIRLITDKQLKRQLIILSKLAKDPEPILEKDMAEYLNISGRTLFEDVKELQKLLPEEVTLVLNHKTGLHIQINEGFLIDSFIYDLAKGSITYKIIEGLYNQKKLSLSEWAEHLFISEQTLKRHLKYLDPVLKEFYLALSVNTMELIGKEENIRFFYYAFYGQSNDLVMTRIPEMEFVESYDKMVAGARNMGMQIDYVDCRKWVYWTMICKERIERGHPITIDLEIKKLIKNRDTYNYFAPFYKEELCRLMKVDEISEDELVFGYVVVLDCLLLVGGNDNSIIDIIEEPEGEHLYSEAKAFCEKYLDDFEVQVSELQELERILQTYLVDLAIMSKVTPLFQKNSNEVNTSVLRQHKEIYAKWINILKKEPLMEQFRFLYLEDISVSLTYLILAFKLEKKAKIKHVLFCYSGEKSYLNYLTSLSRKVVPEGVRCSFVFDTIVNDAYLKAHEVDICVCNYKSILPIKESYLLEVSHVPTVREWTLLGELVFDIPIKK